MAGRVLDTRTHHRRRPHLAMDRTPVTSGTKAA